MKPAREPGMVIQLCEVDFARVLGAPQRPAEERGLESSRHVQKPPGISGNDPPFEIGV
jgi:hypothetical protein